jgi:hypothetical protein
MKFFNALIPCISIISFFVQVVVSEDAADLKAQITLLTCDPCDSCITLDEYHLYTTDGANSRDTMSMINPGSLVLEVLSPEAIKTETLHFKLSMKATIFDTVLDLPPMDMTVENVCDEEYLKPTDNQVCGEAGKYSIGIDLAQIYNSLNISPSMIPVGLEIKSETAMLDKDGTQLANCVMDATIF